MARVYNFSAGPSMLPEAVLKTAQAELLDYHGSGMSVMEMSHRSKWFDVAQCHQGVDVLPPPIVQRKSCACGSVVVSVKGRVGGGVKVVVKVDAV